MGAAATFHGHRSSQQVVWSWNNTKQSQIYHQTLKITPGYQSVKMYTKPYGLQNLIAGEWSAVCSFTYVLTLIVKLN